MGLDSIKTRAARVLAALCCALWLALPIHAAYAQTGTDRLIVHFSDPDTAEQSVPDPAVIDAVSRAAGRELQPLRRASGRAHVLTLDATVPLREAREMAGRIQNLALVRRAQPDRRYQPQRIPDDPEYTRQWYLTGSQGGIDAETAWDLTTGGRSTVVAVLDTGILPHSELTGRTLPGYDFISDVATANDGDGRDPDPADPGDFVTEQESTDPEGPFFDCPAADSSWHGTFIAGLLAANTDNAAGIAGIDHRGSILPVRVLGKCGGFVSDVADAIRWAAGVEDDALPGNSNPARILNLSLGSANECSETEQAAINDAVEAGAIVVAGAGNDGVDAADYAPAGCDNVVTVAATSRQGAETEYTNFGNTIEISAPGGNTIDETNLENGILSISNTGTQSPEADAYAFGYGTSFATPMVAGAAALVISVNPLMSPNDVLFTLQSSARPFPAGTTDGFADCTHERCGAGLLDAASAVAAADTDSLGGGGDGLIRMEADAVCTTEDDAAVTFNVLRESGTGPVAVRLKSQRISASPDTDYQALDDILMWEDGDMEPKTRTIAVNADNAVEGSEFFAIRIVNTSAAVELGAPDSTVVTIVSTDGNTPKACTSDEEPPDDGTDGGSGNMSLPLLAALLSLLAGRKRRRPLN